MSGQRVDRELVCVCAGRVDELHAQDAEGAARRGRDVHQLVRDDANVLSVA